MAYRQKGDYLNAREINGNDLLLRIVECWIWCYKHGRVYVVGDLEMIKLIATTIALLFTPHTQALNVKEANKVLSVSVLIRAKQYRIDPKTGGIKIGMAGCSGTFVSSTTVLTAAHCFSDPTTKIWTRGYGESSNEAVLKKLDASHDLALLEIKGLTRPHKYAKLGKKLRAGEKIVNVGSPLGLEFLLSEGIVSSTKVKVKEFKSLYTVTDAMINAGSSGGGAFNSRGELVGANTMTAGVFGWMGISFAVSLEDLKEFLK